MFKDLFTITVVVFRREMKNACVQYFLFESPSAHSFLIFVSVSFIIYVIYLDNNTYV